MDKLSRTALFALLGLLTLNTAQAGTFTTPHFVEPGRFAIGVEPELILSNGAGLGGNLRYTHGVTDLNNATFLIGTGGGPRRFRVGGNFTFDFFPDVDQQPGIGIALQPIYYRLRSNTGLLELSAVPYIHKNFVNGGNEIEPYLSVPFGWNFTSGNYQFHSALHVGGMFKTHENFRYLLEVGLKLNNTETFISGGVSYFY